MKELMTEKKIKDEQMARDTEERLLAWHQCHQTTLRAKEKLWVRHIDAREITAYGKPPETPGPPHGLKANPDK